MQFPRMYITSSAAINTLQTYLPCTCKKTAIHCTEFLGIFLQSGQIVLVVLTAACTVT